MPWMNFQKPLTNNNNIKLHDAVSTAYKPIRDQQEFYKKKGYVLDRDLSNDNQQVLYNPNEKKLLYNVAGTHNLKDWGTDLYLAMGKLKDTNRYKEADKRLQQAKQKYNVSNATVTGHSLGSSIGQYISKPTDKFYGLDAGYTIGQKTRSYGGNQQHFRTSGDLVSAMGSGARNMKTLSNNNILKDPLTAHNVDNIKNEKIYV